MAGPRFDPTHAVRFDLAHGTVNAGGSERHVVLPCAALDDLVLVAGPEAATAVGRSLGASLGGRIAGRLGGISEVAKSPIDLVLAHLAGELAITGLGTLAIERWGSALVLIVDRPAISDLIFLGAILEGMLEGAVGGEISCVVLGREGTMVRVLATSAKAAERARALLGAGAAWGDVLARLNERGRA